MASAIKMAKQNSLGLTVELIHRLAIERHRIGRLEEKLKIYTVPRLLIIDEIGYLPIDRVGANLFFRLISRR